MALASSAAGAVAVAVAVAVADAVDADVEDVEDVDAWLRSCTMALARWMSTGSMSTPSERM